MKSWVFSLWGIIALVLVFGASVPWLLRPLLRLALLPRYGFRVWGAERVPPKGAAVVIVNHVTWLDGFFLGAVFPRRARALVNVKMLGGPLFRWYFKWLGAIPVPFSGPKAQRAAIQGCRDALDRGQIVVIFPEGQLTRTGFLGPFYRGLELILRGKDTVPVVPVYLDHLWGSIFSFSDGRTLWKRVRGLRRVIGVSFGEPVLGKVNLFHYRQAMTEASVTPVAWRKQKPDELETIDLTLPHFLHPRHGLLSASTPDYNVKGIHQAGSREGTVGLPLPGVAIQAVDEEGNALPPDSVGRLNARIAGESAHWVGLGRRGSVDKDGFIRLV